MKKYQFRFFVDKSLKNHNKKIFIVENSAWRQIKENYQIYLAYQSYRRPQSSGRDSQLPIKKMKTMFL